MRDHNRDKGRLQHIIECIERIKRYSQGYSIEELVADDMRYYAIVKNLEIVGEAANMLTQDFCDAHPETQWKMIIKMRNYIVHEYFNIDNDVVWEVINKDLPELELQINQYLNETNWEDWESQQ